MIAPRYAPPTRRRLEVPHYLVAVDPGTARPGVSVWFVDLVSKTLAPPRVDPNGRARCALVAFGWSPRLIGARAPRDRHEHTPARGASLVVKAAEFLIEEHRRRMATTALHPVVCAVEWPVKYATKTAAHDDVDGLRAMIAELPWTPRLKATPSQWKGNVPKPITDARAIAALQTDPTKPLDDGGTQPGYAWTWEDLAVRGRYSVDDDPNARDAVAIGAYALGIVGRGCSR